MKFSIFVMAVTVLLLSATPRVVGHAVVNDISGENSVISSGSCLTSGLAAAVSGSKSVSGSAITKPIDHAPSTQMIEGLIIHQVIMAGPAPIQLKLVKDVRMRAQTFSSFPFEGAKGFRNAIRDKAMARDIRLASGEYREYGSIYQWYIWSRTENNYTTGRPEETYYLGVSMPMPYISMPVTAGSTQLRGGYTDESKREEIIRERFFEENPNGSYADINRGDSPSINN